LCPCNFLLARTTAAAVARAGLAVAGLSRSCGFLLLFQFPDFKLRVQQKFQELVYIQKSLKREKDQCKQMRTPWPSKKRRKKSLPFFC
jgi:hypothetical protein